MVWPLRHLIKVMRKHDLTNILTIFDNFGHNDTHNTSDIWDTDYNSDNWEPEFMTLFVTWQLIVTLDSIRNSCDVFLTRWLWQCWPCCCGKRWCTPAWADSWWRHRWCSTLNPRPRVSPDFPARWCTILSIFHLEKSWSMEKWKKFFQTILSCQNMHADFSWIIICQNLSK